MYIPYTLGFALGDDKSYILFFEAEGFQPKRKEVRVKDKEKNIDVELKRK